MVVRLVAREGLAIMAEATKPTSPITSRTNEALSTLPQRRITSWFQADPVSHRPARPVQPCV